MRIKTLSDSEDVVSAAEIVFNGRVFKFHSIRSCRNLPWEMNYSCSITVTWGSAL